MISAGSWQNLKKSEKKLFLDVLNAKTVLTWQLRKVAK